MACRPMSSMSSSGSTSVTPSLVSSTSLSDGSSVWLLTKGSALIRAWGDLNAKSPSDLHGAQHTRATSGNAQCNTGASCSCNNTPGQPCAQHKKHTVAEQDTAGHAAGWVASSSTQHTRFSQVRALTVSPCYPCSVSVCWYPSRAQHRRGVCAPRARLPPAHVPLLPHCQACAPQSAGMMSRCGPPGQCCHLQHITRTHAATHQSVPATLRGNV
jgi:hypothetical protein